MTEEIIDDEQMAMLRKCFTMFDSGKKGMIEKEKIRTILNTLGTNFDPEELEAQLTEKDPDGTGFLRFENFAKVVGHFLEDKDEEAMQKELKEAFRLYDKDDDRKRAFGSDILKKLNSNLRSISNEIN